MSGFLTPLVVAQFIEPLILAPTVRKVYRTTAQFQASPRGAECVQLPASSRGVNPRGVTQQTQTPFAPTGLVFEGIVTFYTPSAPLVLSLPN